MTRKALLVCETRYVLLNSLILAGTELADDDVDVALTDRTDWGGDAIATLENSGLFRSVIQVPMDEINASAPLWSDDERRAHEKSPGEFFADVGFANDYTDMWINLTNMANQLLWAYLVETGGKEPIVHFIEEGTASYTLRPFDDPTLIGSWPMRRRFIANMSDVWLVNTKMWSGSGRIPLRPRQLDSGIVKDEAFSALLASIFTASRIPDERYIFFEECYLANRHTVNDLETLELFADFVGRENIRVRLHPRTKTDRFTPLGYKVAPQDGSVWELACLSQDLSSKTLVTVKSSAVFSTLAVAEKPPKVVVLRDMVEGYFPNNKAEEFSDYLKHIQHSLGDEETVLYAPRSAEELEVIARRLAKRGGRP